MPDFLVELGRELYPQLANMLFVSILIIPVIGIVLLFYRFSNSYRRKRALRQHAAYVTRQSEFNARIGLQFEIQVLWLLKSYGFQRVYHNKIVCGAQIDIILLHETGIYILECKNWSGTIIGKESWKRWLKVMNFRPYGNYQEDRSVNISSTEMYSPIYQNNTHVYAMKEYLLRSGLDGVPVYNIIVFSDNADLRFLECGDSHIVHPQNLISYITTLIKDTEHTNLLPEGILNEIDRILSVKICC